MIATACQDCVDLQEIAEVLGDTEDVRRVVSGHRHLHALSDERERLRQRNDALEAEYVVATARLAPHEGGMRVTPDVVAQKAFDWFAEVGEWPHPWEMHECIADWAGCPLEVAQYDVLNALNRADVYGLPSIVAMRLGEAFGNWLDPNPLPSWDNGFRIAVREERWPDEPLT